MAYNLRSRLTSTSAHEGSSVASMSEGLGLSPVEFAVPMSEQATAGYGPDLLGLPIVIEGNPEALQTAASIEELRVLGHLRQQFYPLTHPLIINLCG